MNHERRLPVIVRVGAVLSAGLAGLLVPQFAGAPSAAAAPAVQAIGRFCGPAVLAARVSSIEAQLTGRVNQLHELQSEVSASSTVTPSDRATLSTDLANELAGIGALQSKVAGDATCLAVSADRQAMVVNYRVYVVMTPQVHLTLSTDAASSVAGEFTSTLEGQLTSAIDAAQNSGTNVSEARAEDAELVTKVSEAAASTATVSSVLSFTPASYPGCWSTFQSDRRTLHKVQKELRRADKLLHSIVRLV